jgi:hypothetical protein
VAIGISLIVGACSATAPTPVPVDACALVPNMDEIVGRAAVDRPAGFTLNNVDRCVWTYQTDPSRSIGISVSAVAAHTSAIQSLGAGEQVAGFGEEARWWASNRMLSVAIGNRALQVDLQIDDPAGTRELAVSIAQAALANMD